MKEFDPHMVTITQEEYNQLRECRIIVERLWLDLGPYNFPKELDSPFLSCNDAYPHPSSIRTRIGSLMEFDDGE